MSAEDDNDLRRRLREVLRTARFGNWPLHDLEDVIFELFGREVDDQPPVTPDQIAEPQSA